MPHVTPPPMPPRMHLPSLLAALAIMLVGTLYPPLMADMTGKADHALALALLLAMGVMFFAGGVGDWRTLANINDPLPQAMKAVVASLA